MELSVINQAPSEAVVVNEERPLEMIGKPPSLDTATKPQDDDC